MISRMIKMDDSVFGKWKAKEILKRVIVKKDEKMINGMI